MTAVALGRDASWRERAATLAIFLALGIEVGTWAAAIPTLRNDLDLDPARLSLVLLTLSIASVLATLAMGVIAPRFGNGRATSIAALATIVGFALPGFAGSFLQLAVCGAAIGLAAGSLEVAVNGHASDIETRWGSAIMSSFHAAFSIGGLLGASLGGFAASSGAGLRGQLWLPLALAAVLVIGAWPALGRGARGEPGHGPGFVRPTRALLVLGLLGMASYLLEGAMADWSALYMSSVATASTGMAAAGFAAFSVTMATGRLTGDVIVNRLGAPRVLTLGGFVAAVGLGLAVLVPSPWVVAIGFALVGIGAANVVPVVFSAAGGAGTSPAAGIAMVSTFAFAGFLGGPPLIGAIATVAGLRIAIASLVLVAIIIAALGFVLGPSGSPQRPERRSRT